MTIKIETERLILREILPTDEDGIFELDSNPAVHTYLGKNPAYNKEQVRKYIQTIQQQYIDNGIGLWAVIDKFTNEFIGLSGLKHTKEPINNHIDFFEIGYGLIEKYWEKGMATETTHAVLNYAFETFKIETVYAICETGNKGSKNVLQKSGFILIETFRHEEKEKSWFEITKDEWLKMKS